MLCPTPRPDLESMIQMSARLQSAVEAPVSVGARAIHATCHTGFCLMGRASAATGEAMLSAAETAAAEAARQGPSAIRAYSRTVQKTAQARSDLSAEAAEALEAGHIRLFFQPQISTDTGDLIGLQVAPRWLHRKRGILGERDVTAAINAAGLQQRFAEVMLFQAFGAQRKIDASGASYGTISLPVSGELLCDPTLIDRIRWELDRFDIAPSRVCLTLSQETAAQIDQEIVAHNMSRIAGLGCLIELAGFGNGPVSVATIKRTGAHRMRIHSSFVTKIDQDPEQQRVVAAMISLCEGLGLQSLAEGATTIGEYAMLGQLGCAIVQGNAIAAPMPIDELGGWARRHRAKLAAPPRIDKRRGM
jgi:EAL domain-containing protein (putative c-di-GMP-specific phosphodiesterase class I)